MKLFHRHKWEYLGKEHHVKETSRYYHLSLTGSGSSETEKTNVTTIRFFCKGCTELKAQTVEGTVRSAEIMKMGLFGKSAGEE